MKSRIFTRVGLLAVGLMLSLSVQAGALTDYAENKTVDALIRAQAIGAPVTWYVALYTVCPTDATAAHRRGVGRRVDRDTVVRPGPGLGERDEVPRDVQHRCLWDELQADDRG